MICLVFDFTSDRRSVAVAKGDEVLAEAVHSEGRKTPVFALIDRVLAESGVRRESVRRLAVSVGPGSYTGIRVAISTAQGWHLATGAEVVAVETFEVLRHAAGVRALSTPVTFAVDAQRNEFAVRTLTGGGWEGPLHLEGCDRVLARLADGQTVLGPELGKWFRGVAKISPAVGQRAGAAELFPTAGIVARLASTLPPIPPESLAPVYLREAAFVKAPPGRVISGITG